MSKLIAGLLTSILLAAGLVAFSGTSAQAACNRYGGCPATSTNASGPAVKRVGQPAKYSVAIRVRGSNAAPRGRVRVIVTGTGRRVSNFRYVQTKSAKKTNFFTFGRKFPVGRFQVRIVFISNGSQDNSFARTLALKNRRP